MSRIGVIGAGHVGLVVAASLAHLGHQTTCVEKDRAKLVALLAGRTPFLEPGLPELMAAETAADRLRFSGSCLDLADAEVAFVAVDAPLRPDGIDMSNVVAAVESLGRSLRGTAPVVAIKTTLAPGTTVALERRMRDDLGSVISVVANPEFLREGSAVADFLNPDRVVIGAGSRQAAEAVASVYRGLACPVVITDCTSAELIKLASNAFLATKVSFINEIAGLCEGLGADILEVARGVGLDRRIGPEYLRAGLGFGGSCLPKDLRILIDAAGRSGHPPEVLPAVLSVNDAQVRRAVRRLEIALAGLEGKRVAVLGLAFKPGTDDVRGSPALRLADELARRGAQIRTCDPADGLSGNLPQGCGADPYEAARGCDALVLATEWPQFSRLDFPRLRRIMRDNVLLDARNALDLAVVSQAGFRYFRLGAFQAQHPGVPGKPAPGGQGQQSRLVAGEAASCPRLAAAYPGTAVIGPHRRGPTR